MTRLRQLTALMLALSLGGCSMFGGQDNTAPPAPLVEFSPTLQVEGLVQWHASAGDGLEEEQFLQLTPAVYDQTVVATDPEDGVTAFDLNTGKQLWQAALDGVAISSGAGLSAELAVVGSSEGEVVALNAATGQELWRAQVSSEVLAPPQIASGIVVIRTLDGKLFGLDSQSGNRIWVYERSVPILTLRGVSTPLIIGPAVVSGFDNGKLAIVQLDNGTLIQEVSIAVPRGRSDLERMVDIDGNLIVMGDVLYVASYQGRIVAMNLRDGHLLWQRDLSSYSGIGADDSYIYVSDADNQVWAFDRFNGTAAWKQSKLTGRLLTAPISTGNFVVVGDLEGYLHWMRVEDGQFVGRYQTDDSRILVPPVLADGRLVVYNNSGQVTVLAAP